MARKILSIAKRKIGPDGWRKRGVILLVLAAAAGLSAVAVLAVHDTGRFELDGNAVTTISDDWDEVCHEATGSANCGTTNNTNGAIAVSWTGDCPVGSSGIGCNNNNATIFTGGGSKDPQDISNWAWKDGAGGLPDKDNLVHAFAARYSLAPSATCPSGGAATCDVIFFGSDRFDNSGDAQQGFWFLQNKVGLGSNSVGGGQGFTGLHKAGDLLVISDFSNGGTTSTIKVFKWDPVCTATNKPDPSCADANLRTLATSDAANCATAQAADAFCGIVNTSAISTPWSTDYTDKSGNNSYIAGEFYEAGVNLSTLGLAGECFSTVVSETRSSTSTTATLKDFVLGNFANCFAGMETTASATVASPVLPGTPVHDTAVISITGGTNAPDPTGDVTFFLCGPIASGDCSTGGTNIGTGTLNGGANTNDGTATAISPDVNTAASPLASGRYCFRGEWPGDANYTGTSHTNATTECFAVKDTSSLTTAQVWVPNDMATVVIGSGAQPSGTVTFTLYSGGTCAAGNEVATFANRPVDPATGTATTNNTSTYVSTSTISWRAVFTPTNPNQVSGSTGHCETSTLTINNDIGS